MDYLGKVLRKIKLQATKLIYSTGARRVMRRRINNYDLLVLVNEDVGREIYFTGRYEINETMFLRREIRSTDICLDVGGNVGYFSLLMAELATDGQVHVFEPIDGNVELIKRSTGINKFTNIRIVQTAVGDQRGVTTFTVSRDSAYSSMRDTKRKPVETIVTVPIVTLDGYISQQRLDRVDILKIDVEGAEELVLRGATQLLSDQARRPRIVFVELYDLNLAAFSSSIDSVLNVMKAFHYTPYVVRDTKGSLRPFGARMKNRFWNVIFVAE